MGTRNEATDAYRTAKALWAKAHANADKLRFMSMTEANRFAFEQYGDQLKAQFDAAGEASKRFAALVLGLSTEDVVSIISKADAAENALAAA